MHASWAFTSHKKLSCSVPQCMRRSVYQPVYHVSCCGLERGVGIRSHPFACSLPGYSHFQKSPIGLAFHLRRSLPSTDACCELGASFLKRALSTRAATFLVCSLSSLWLPRCGGYDLICGYCALCKRVPPPAQALILVSLLPYVGSGKPVCVCVRVCKRSCLACMSCRVVVLCCGEHACTAARRHHTAC
jgi:hypothetical protein